MVEHAISWITRLISPVHCRKEGYIGKIIDQGSKDFLRERETKICNPSSSRGKICPDNIQRMNTNDHRVKDYFWSNDRFWLLFFVIPATWPPAPGHLKCKNYRQAGYP